MIENVMEMTRRKSPFAGPLPIVQAASSEQLSTTAVPGRSISLAAIAGKFKFNPRLHNINLDIFFVLAEGESCEFGSGKFYALCGLGGILSCGITHTAITPLDLVKCRIQTNGAKYKNIASGFKVTVAEEGIRGLGRGWAPTAIGYSMQGLGKFGLYEVFKIQYTDLIGEENAFLWRTSVYLAASASAEFFADILLCPMEACKVRIQTQPGCSSKLSTVFPQILKTEGWGGLYKGITPLWMRQIPYTMMKFACFERTVELIYKNVMPKPRAQCSKGEQLLVTFAAGYIGKLKRQSYPLCHNFRLTLFFSLHSWCFLRHRFASGRYCCF